MEPNTRLQAVNEEDIMHSEYSQDMVATCIVAWI